MDKKTGVFFTGGGTNGSFLIGFCGALEALDIKPEVYFGSSAGAIIGGAATYLQAKDMVDRWKTLTLESVLGIPSSKVENLTGSRRTLGLYLECMKSCLKLGMIPIENIRSLLYNALDGEAIRDSSVDFGLLTTKLPYFDKEVFFKKDMEPCVDVREYILASLYLPIFQRKPIIDGEQYIDIGRIYPYSSGLKELTGRGLERVIAVNIETNREWRITKPLERLFPPESGVEVIYINYENKPSILDFGKEQVDRNIQRGLETSLDVFAEKGYPVKPYMKSLFTDKRS